MSSHDSLVVTEKRLSLDLPQPHHEMIDQIAKFCGFPSKTEVVKAAVRQFYDQMSLVLEGNEIIALAPTADASVLRENGADLIRFHGTDLAHLARRVRSQRAAQSSGKAAELPPKPVEGAPPQQAKELT